MLSAMRQPRVIARLRQCLSSSSDGSASGGLSAPWFLARQATSGGAASAADAARSAASGALREPRRRSDEARFPTLAQDDAARSIQRKLFGYAVDSTAGKRTGRRALKHALFHRRVSDYYPALESTMRVRDMSLAKKGAAAYARRILQGFPLQGAPDKEPLGPALPHTREGQRAELRARAAVFMDEAVLASTAIETTASEIRRLTLLKKLRMRGKAAPKKGGGKRATRKK